MENANANSGSNNLWYEGSFGPFNWQGGFDYSSVDEISDNTKDVLDNMNEEK